jgi:uncharacterized protein
MNNDARWKWVYASLIALLVVLLLVFWPKGNNENIVSAPPPEAKAPAVVFEEPGSKDIEEPSLPTGEPKAPEARHGMALILDDVGYNLPELRRALNLHLPMAISILPDAPFAAEAARLAHAAGDTVMLHMPMEPANPHYQKLMDGSFIRVGMSHEQVREMMLAALDKVPYVEGVNNHMGSRLTELEEPMRWVMEVCREKKLFFVDSRTNSDSVAARVARSAGLRWGERQVFLDNSVKPELLEKSWLGARHWLAKHGFVIVIAHPHKETLDFLQQQLTDGDRADIVPLDNLLFPAIK